MSLKAALARGKFVVTAEVSPPKGTDVSSMVANATTVKRLVDAFVVPEMSNAVMRLSSLGGSLLLQSKGLETVMQVCCRDRNRLALQGDLLAAQALGIPNVMVVAGEDITHGDHHQAKAVNDVDLMELLTAIQTLQAGRDMAGVDLKGAPDFLVGHFAPAMENHRAHFMAFAEEADDLILANLIIVFRGGGPELDFLQLRTAAALALLVGLLALLVEEFAVIRDLADWRIRGGRDFHQVQSSFAGHAHGLERLHYPELSSFFVDDSYFARPDPFVYADTVGLPEIPFSDKSPLADKRRPASRATPRFDTLSPEASASSGQVVQYITPREAFKIGMPSMECRQARRCRLLDGPLLNFLLQGGDEVGDGPRAEVALAAVADADGTGSGFLGTDD
jgi:hypothetical protein